MIKMARAWPPDVQPNAPHCTLLKGKAKRPKEVHTLRSDQLPPVRAGSPADLTAVTKADLCLKPST